MDLRSLQRNWEHFGEADPLWSVCSHAQARGRRWDTESFYQTGRDEVTEVTVLLDDEDARGRCLDFGCGVGRLSFALADHFDTVVGVDIAPSMIRQAEQHAQGGGTVTFVLNERADLHQFDTATFDFVYSSVVLQHMRPVFARAYLREFARLLAPGGLAVFTLPSEPSGTLKARAYRLLPAGVINAYKRRRDGATMEMNHIPVAQLIGELESFGFAVERVRVSDSAGPNWVAFQYFVRRIA